MSQLDDLVGLIRGHGWFCSEPREARNRRIVTGGTQKVDPATTGGIDGFTGTTFVVEGTARADSLFYELWVRIAGPGQRSTTARFKEATEAFNWMKTVIHTVSYHDIMEQFIVAWTLSASLRDDEERYLPDEPGILEHALKEVLDAGAFPSWQRRIHFTEGPIGLVCVELPRILALARHAELATGIERLRVTIRHSGANRLAHRLGIPADDLHKWGMQLREAVEHAREMLADYPKVPL